MRIGTGYDVHRLVPDRDLIIGGVRIPYEKGLLGHSDADVLLHAVMDALLGAAALGDMLGEKGFVVENIDSTIIAQAPKMRPYIDTMRENIAGALGLEIDFVSVKATTEEGMGFTGAGEGISAQAVCLLTSPFDLTAQQIAGGCEGCSGCRKA